MKWFRNMNVLGAQQDCLKGIFNRPAVWMALACLIWLVAFRDFFTGQSRISSDALSYFDHTVYFIENIKRGVFPLWDVSWNHGASNDFFLRRIGCYNPIYLVMAVLTFIGLSHTVIYLLVLSCYFFFGAWGLSLLVQALYKDERVSFAAFALFLFSTAGVRIFDSYMCLVIVPTIWFFYFLTVFCLDPRRRSLAGLCLSFMIAMNTYIPLFFLTIVFAVLLLGGLFFYRDIGEILKRVGAFVVSQPVFCGVMGALVLASLIPPLMFFLDTRQPTIVLSERHGDSSAPHVLTVDTKLLSWGLMEDLFYTGYFTDFRRFLSALVYVPFVGVLLWVWGGFCRMNRRIALYLSLAVFFVLLGTPLAAPLYQFLYDHVFYFKYMRNLHFFLWFLLLPLSVLISAEFLAQILRMPIATTAQKWGAGIIAVVSLSGFLIFTIWLGDGVATTFLVILATLIFVLAYIFRRDMIRGWVLWGGILLLVAPQACQVFHYISRNAPLGGTYGNAPLGTFKYTIGGAPQALADNACGSLYYSTSYFNDLCQNVSGLAYTSSMTHSLVAYGRVEPMVKTPQGYGHLDAALSRNLDVAFASELSAPLVLSPQDKPIRFEKNTDVLSVRYADTNTLSLKTNFAQEKFLVYADSFAKGWQAFVDGKRVDLYPANLAYKGVRVPAGERRVDFRYRQPLWYGFNWFLLICFNLVFYGVIVSFCRSRTGRVSA